MMINKATPRVALRRGPFPLNYTKRDHLAKLERSLQSEFAGQPAHHDLEIARFDYRLAVEPDER